MQTVKVKTIEKEKFVKFVTWFKCRLFGVSKVINYFSLNLLILNNRNDEEEVNKENRKEKNEIRNINSGAIKQFWLRKENVSQSERINGINDSIYTLEHFVIWHYKIFNSKFQH